MTNRVHRILCLVLSLVMVLSVVSVNASADTYTKGSIYRSNDPNKELPTLELGLVWSAPVESQELTCSLTEHTHGANCKTTATTTNPGTGNYSSTETKYYIWSVWHWIEVGESAYNLVAWPDFTGVFEGVTYYKRTTYYKYDCTAHTHSASCYTTWYTWTVVEAAKYTVSYAWAENSEVPADATLPTGGSYYAGETVEIAANPTSTSKVNGELQGTWKFSGWTASTELGENNTMPEENVTFVGGWTFTEDAKYTVTYSFVSGTDGKTLPAEVTAKLPEKASVYEGTTVTPASDLGNVIVNENGVTVGTWSFNGWNPTSATVNADTEFVGTWVYTEAEKYNVTYQWADAENVPSDAELPTDTNSYYAGQTVKIADNLTSTSTKKGELQGEWTFSGWTASPELTDGKMPASSVTVTGGWTFTEDPKGKLVYAWKEGTDVPADAVLPEDNAYYYVGSTVTVAEDPTSTSTVNGEMQGTWEFLGWDTSVLPNGKMPEGSEKVVIEGEWKFTEANKYSYTLIYNGNGGVSGTETSLKDSENVENVYDASFKMTVDDCAFTLEDYEFQGWAESLEDAAAGIVTVEAGASVEFSSEVTSKTLYAVWKKVIFSLTVSKTSTGYEFKDGDNISFSVAINGDTLNGTKSISYSAETGWSSFVVENLREGDEVTVTELSPHKNNYVLSVSDANGNHVAAKKGDYAQTVTITGDAAIAFANAYTAYAEEYTPTPVVPTTPDIPATGDSAGTITVAVAMILMSAMVAFVAMRKREN
jgi:LPXTG-motif cell wall-anchored protein